MPHVILVRRKAKALQASAVVLSYHHRPALVEFLMGSVTSKVGSWV